MEHTVQGGEAVDMARGTAGGIATDGDEGWGEGGDPDVVAGGGCRVQRRKGRLCGGRGWETGDCGRYPPSKSGVGHGLCPWWTTLSEFIIFSIQYSVANYTSRRRPTPASRSIRVCGTSGHAAWATAGPLRTRCLCFVSYHVP